MGEWRVTGQKRAVQMLRGAIGRGRVGHAYLLVGPAGSGKGALARAFAQALNCVVEDPPCNQCPTCRRISRSEDFDVREIGVAEGHQVIQIDQVREFERRASLTSSGSRYKIAIVSRAELLTEEAANAFLKTLEEPPRNTVIVLGAPAREAVLATVASRCIAVNLGPVARAEIRQALAGELELTADDLELILDHADGRPGWAIDMALNAEKLENFKQTVSTLVEALAEGPVGRLNWAQELGPDRERALEAVEVLARYHGVEGRRFARASLEAEPSGFEREGFGPWLRNLRRIRFAHDALRANTMVRPTTDSLALALEELPGRAR